MGKVISICKDGIRYDIPLKKLEIVSVRVKDRSEWGKQEPIASDEPVISRGAIVTLRGHKGKVLLTEGDMASVSWEDAAISKVPIKDLKYEGRVEKGGPGSGRHPEGGSKYALSEDDKQVAALSQKHGFGTVAWQDAMLNRIREKVKNKQELSSNDKAFAQTQIMHNAKLADELKAMGAEGINLN